MISEETEEQVFADWYAGHEEELTEMFIERLSQQDIQDFLKDHHEEIREDFEIAFERFVMEIFANDMDTINER